MLELLADAVLDCKELVDDCAIFVSCVTEGSDTDFAGGANKLDKLAASGGGGDGDDTDDAATKKDDWEEDGFGSGGIEIGDVLLFTGGIE